MSTVRAAPRSSTTQGANLAIGRVPDGRARKLLRTCAGSYHRPWSRGLVDAENSRSHPDGRAAYNPAPLSRKRRGLVIRISSSFLITPAAFSTYLCTYAFRKPFTAATYDDLALGGVDYKTLLVIAQVAGYALSKFVGIR